ncbi:MAG: hypothetical protein LRY55_08655 [Leadbetterella sp.]|nr:hypothetical protein [Leadbetterella sp.]
MKKIGLKNIAFALVLAAVSAPFLWEWAKPLWQTPASPYPPADIPAVQPVPEITAEPASPVKEEEAAAVLTRTASAPAQEAPATLPLALPEIPEGHDDVTKIKEQETINPEEAISELKEKAIPEPETEEPLNSSTPEPEVKTAPGVGGVLPPLAVIDADVPPALDYTGGRIVRTSLRLVNRSAGEFSGNLSVEAPKGIRSISGERINVTMQEGDTLFVPVVFMMGGTVLAGDNRVDYTLKDIYDREVEKGSSRIPVTEKVSLQLSLDQPLIMVTHMDDSLSLSARVHNRGNTDQLVAVVMGLPLNRGGKSFYELRGEVMAGRDTLFTLKVRPADIFTGNENVVYVNINGLYGPEKQPFGNVNLGIQSVISSRRYTDNAFSNAMMLYDNQHVPDDITLSYRRFGQTNMYQVMGGGHIDLPAGNLSMQGLVYKMEGQNELIALNTHASYRYNNNSLTVGSINEQLEYSTFGRGVKAVVSDKSGKNTVKLGVVDHQFNLFSAQPLFENGYSFFVKDYIGAPNARQNTVLDYMFRNDPWEKARHHIAGGEWTWNKDNNWRV